MKVNKRLLGFMIAPFIIIGLGAFQISIAEKNDKFISANAFTDPITGMEFLRVKGGCFQMGNGFEHGQNDEKHIHIVCLDDYYIGKFEVTLQEFKKFVDETNYQTDRERGTLLGT